MKSKRALTYLLLVTILISCSDSQQIENQTKESLKVGAILPLSGSAAIWGEAIQNGMELAQEELAKEGMTIGIQYEDSQAIPTLGLSAYKKLVEQDKVNIVISAFSRVSVPLISLVERDRMPLLMTMVAAKGVTENSQYAFRFYSTEKDYAYPHFDILKSEYTSLGLLYLNDEYGVSVAQAIRDKAKENNVKIVVEETFDPATTDFRTQLLKIKAKNPQALLFVGAVPTEVVNAMKQVKEMQLDSIFFEASPNLGLEPIRATAGGSAEGVYTLAYPLTLGMAGAAFSEAYRERYGEAPLHAAAFGYDMVVLAAKASNGKSVTGKALVDKILALKSFDSLNGPVQIQSTREINPSLYSVKIVNGSLVRT
ncbi:MAG TPA: ABC transporter substrate-binding protein [Candidatus Nanoarchaeia archaeon]|nr:ABC transporter substrate-binding protein [Candidatus Nanoarchaeia archaeon]